MRHTEVHLTDRSDARIKVSDYTHVFRYADGVTLAYNSLSGQLLDLSGGANDLAVALERRTATFGSALQRDVLLEQGFVVDEDVNELNVVKEIWRRGRTKKGDALLTILPTLGCNFDCPYCFEHHTKGLMSKEVQDALVRFTTQHLLKKSRSLAIDWFGGEPLTGIGVIEAVTERLRSACEQNDVPTPNASLTTNGYLLNPAMYKKLLRLGVTSAQVTLDGPPEIHNRRRPLLGGQATFDRIVANVQAAPQGFSVVIRVNVDEGNKDHVFSLLELLAAKGITPRASVSLGLVEPFSEECRLSECRPLSSIEYAHFKASLHQRCQSAGMSWLLHDSPRLVAYGYCIVDQPKGFVVQPDGKLLKCWAEAGNSTRRPVADLLDEATWRSLFTPRARRAPAGSRTDGRTRGDGPKRSLTVLGQQRVADPDRIAPVSSLQSRDPFDDDECCACSLLPACMGGCPAMRENLRQQGMKRCPPLRYSLQDEVRALFARLQAGAATKDERPLQRI